MLHRVIFIIVKYPVIAIFVFLLAGCGNDAPVQLKNSERQFIGAWHYFYEKKSSNSLEYQNVLLMIKPDSHVAYMKCIVHYKLEIGENHNITSKSSNRTRVNLPNAIVTELTQKQLTLQQKALIFHIHYQLDINKAPYQQGGNWYLGVDNLVLKKITPAMFDKLNWICPDPDKTDRQDS